MLLNYSLHWFVHVVKEAMWIYIIGKNITSFFKCIHVGCYERKQYIWVLLFSKGITFTFKEMGKIQNTACDISVVEMMRTVSICGLILCCLAEYYTENLQ